ncbi:Odorant receptor 72, partial [Frankliniella occidentalis]
MHTEYLSPRTSSIQSITDGERDGPLTQHLRWWLKHISPGRLNNQTHRLLMFIRGSKVGMFVSINVLTLAIADACLSGSVFKSPVLARFGLGVYSCLWSQLVFLSRTQPLLACLRRLIGLTTEFERHGTATDLL